MTKKCSRLHRACRRSILVAVLVAACWPAPGTVRADDWPNWRGPTVDGVAAGSGYPTRWSPTENVLWKATLPGLGASTPAVWGDRLVVTCAIGDRDAAICFDRNGREIWRRDLGTSRPGKHKKATGCNSSPVTDGTHVWLYFKSGELACLRLDDGTVAWKTNLQERFGADTLWWDLGTSPVLTSKAVVVAVMQSGPSYLAAFDRGSGELLWKQDRSLDAPEEAAQSYSTPVVVAGDVTKGEPGEILFVLGADHVTAHDALTGREVWRAGGLNPTGHKFFRSIASPVVAGDVVIAPYARGGTITAIRRGGAGDVTATHVAWTRNDLGTDVPTPAARHGRVVVCTDKGQVVCLEAATGKTVWTVELPKNRHAYSASPVIVDGRIIVTREDGESSVLAPARSGGAATAAPLDGPYEVVGTGSIDEMTVATPVCVDGRIFLRTHDSLWCVGSKPARLLVVSVTSGFRHSSIATAEAAIEEIGRTSGLFHADFLRLPPGRLPQPKPPQRAAGTSDDDWSKQQQAFAAEQERFRRDDQTWQAGLRQQFARAFAPESLAAFDGMIFASTTGPLPIPDLEGWLGWLRTGKAFIGFHAASDTLKESDAYCDMIGGHFAGHPWNSRGEHGFVVHEPAHPVTAMLPARFRWQDEIYQYDPRYKPGNLRVLVSLDMAASSPKEPWHVPVSWIREYGAGRVFYTNFGHNEATWNEPMFRRHAREGIAWALRRFDASAAANPDVQAAEFVRSAVAAAAAASGGNADELRAKADAKIAADPAWAAGQRPGLEPLRALPAAARADGYKRLLGELDGPAAAANPAGGDSGESEQP